MTVYSCSRLLDLSGHIIHTNRQDILSLSCMRFNLLCSFVFHIARLALKSKHYLVKRYEEVEEMFLEICFTKKHQRHLTKL